jgi:hypothetical protein
MDLLTMTHARIRLSQGDVSGARAILREILRRDPSHGQALQLLDALRHRASRPAESEADETLCPPEAADLATLRRRFRAAIGERGAASDVRRRIERLRRWLDRLSRGGPPGLGV